MVGWHSKRKSSFVPRVRAVGRYSSHFATIAFQALLMAIFSSMAVQCGYFCTNDVMLGSVYVGQIYFLQISELASMKQPKDSLQLAKPTRNSRKIANKLTTVAPGEINMQSKHNLVCHVPKVKAATSAHSMAAAIPF